MSKLKLSLCCFAVILVAGCHVKITGDNYPKKVAAVLDAAGDNRAQLEQVIEHYRQSGDTLKLKAAYFLIGNLKDKSYVTYRLFDTSGVTVPLDVLSFPDYKALTHAVDSIERERGELDYEHIAETEDAEVLTADYLIHNIDAAFTAWHEKPWARGLTFDEFCNYVLPYRGSNEPLENWRDTFLTRYANLTTELPDSADPIAAAARINDDIKSWFTFDPRYYYHPTDQGVKEMFASGKGRCEDMTNLAIYAMRANGLAVTSDYTPYWANSGNNHAWNAIVTPDGKVVPFMGCEANPGTYHLWNKLAKVYRKTFAQQPTTLAMQPHKQDSLPRFLGGDSYLDVTADYVPTVEVTVTLTKPVPDSVDIAYICVFNSGHWRPIDWGRIAGDKVTFHNIGTEIMYLPALYLNKDVVPCGDPFVPSADSQITICRHGKTRTTVTAVSTTRRTQKASTDSIRKSFLAAGTAYDLFYWDDGWQKVGEKTAGTTPLSFDNVPDSGLYWLVAKDSNREERIFTIEQGRQVWW